MHNWDIRNLRLPMATDSETYSTELRHLCSNALWCFMECSLLICSSTKPLRQIISLEHYQLYLELLLWDGNINIIHISSSRSVPFFMLTDTPKEKCTGGTFFQDCRDAEQARHLCIRNILLFCSNQYNISPRSKGQRPSDIRSIRLYFCATIVSCFFEGEVIQANFSCNISFVE